MVTVVTRHRGLVDWLIKHEIINPNDDINVIEHATVEDVKGCIVYGILPLSLAVHAKAVYTPDMPGLPLSRRGTELTADDMDTFGATLSHYVVMAGDDYLDMKYELDSAVKHIQFLNKEIGAAEWR